MGKGSPGRTVVIDPGAVPVNRTAPSREQLLSAIEAVARITAEAESVTTGLARALETFCVSLGWPIGHVFRRVEETRPRLISAEFWCSGEPGRFTAFQEVCQGTTFRPGQGLVGQVLAQQRPGLSADVARDRRFLRRRAARADDVHAWLAFPVCANGQVLAVCEILTTERVELDQALTGLLTCAGLILGQLYERENGRLVREALRRQLPDTFLALIEQDRTAVNALAAAIAHEVNSPLFSARASLALLDGKPADRALIASAQEDLARIAAVMERLHSLAETAPLGQRLATFLDPPLA
ncbi:MAG TPA: GAF domain-containing protein [Chloroflexaceae bacterium]|nr:GAF domain-containing protein [Chloroflexaceae bacterium]